MRPGLPMAYQRAAARMRKIVMTAATNEAIFDAIALAAEKISGV